MKAIHIMMVFMVILFMVALAINTSSAKSFAQGGSDPLDISVALIWEGEALSSINKESLSAFRQKFSAAKMIHFISPVYFTRAVKDSRIRENELAKALELIGKDDVVGIYLNGWKSITESAGVSFRNSPTFWGNTLSPRQCLDDCGREVLMTAYPADDLRKIIRKSRALFAKNGFGNATIMQVAGNAAGPAVLGAASAEGITHDFSAIAVELLAPRLYRYPLRQQLNDLWSGVGPLMRPFELKAGNGTLTQMTANGLNLEFMSETEITARLDAMMGSGDIAPPKTPATRHLYIGVSMETFAISQPKLEFSLQEVFRRSSEMKGSLRWTAENISKINGALGASDSTH